METVALSKVNVIKPARDYVKTNINTLMTNDWVVEVLIKQELNKSINQDNFPLPRELQDTADGKKEHILWVHWTQNP